MPSIVLNALRHLTVYRIIIYLFTGLLIVPIQNAFATSADSNPDRQTLINLTQNYFNAVGAKDVDSLSNLLLPKAQFIYRNGEEIDSTIGVTSASELLGTLPQLKSELFERMQEPTVLIQGDIGMVWTRYDFYMNKQFSHCGTDVFTFLKTKEGWKMAGGSWAVEKKTCNPVPLGTPLK
jgi:Putative lumazine-binding